MWHIINAPYFFFRRKTLVFKSKFIFSKLFDSPVRSDGTQKWVDFTHDFWHVDCVRSGSQNAFAERYRKWYKRNRYQFSMEKAAEVYALAKSAIVLVQKTSVTKTLVQEAANQLTAISRSVETCRSEMNKLASQLPEYPVVMEMYGVGESARSSWQRLGMCAALSANSHLLPLQALTRRRANRAIIALAAIRPRNAALM